MLRSIQLSTNEDVIIEELIFNSLEMCQNVHDSVHKRYELCIHHGGYQSEQFLR
jgi:hypothetical protein